MEPEKKKRRLRHLDESGGGLVKTYFHTTTAISLDSGGADGGSGRG